VNADPFEAKQGRPAVGKRKGVAPKADDTTPGRRQRIRCPKCAWQPRPEDRWQCTCLHAWNTFDTRGRCPSCGFQWIETQCFRCQQMSLHEDWYEKEPDHLR
jgi:hypothetical protein